MNLQSLSRDDRRDKLAQVLDEDPFITDEELARRLGVSIPTIRLDRLALGIPEVRQRVKQVAQEAYSQVKAIRGNEIVGELVDLELGKSAISILEVKDDMLLEESRIARGHHLFAQANSLAVAVIDAERVVTGSCRLRFKRPVFLGEKVIAKAVVKLKRGYTCLVSVYSRVGGEVVFKGQFIVLPWSGGRPGREKVEDRR